MSDRSTARLHTTIIDGLASWLADQARPILAKDPAISGRDLLDLLLAALGEAAVRRP